MKYTLTFTLLFIVACSFAQGTSNRPIEKFPKGGINGLSMGNTLIGTTDNGTERFYPQFAVISCQGSASVISVSTISIGTNSPNYDNIIPATLLTSLTAVNNMLRQQVSGVISTIPANTGIYVRVSGVAVAGTYTIKAMLYGDYN